MKLRSQIVVAFVCLLLLTSLVFVLSLPARAQIAEIDDGVLGMELPGLLRDNFDYLAGRVVTRGTTPPGTCTVGQVFFDTDASPGKNVYGCSSTNTWTLQGGGGTLEIEDSGGVVGIQPKLRFTADGGVTLAVTEGSGRIDVLASLNTAVVLTRSQAQAGADLVVAPASGSGTAYVASMSPALDAYTDGMVIHFRPDVSNTGAATLNIDGQGAIDILQADGTTDPGSGDLVAGRQYALYYKASIPAFVMPPAGGGGGGTVTSVGLTMPTEFSVSGAPVTASGGFTVSKATQGAHAVYAGPTTGSPAAPTFRALTRDDIPPADRIVYSGVDTVGDNTTGYVPLLSYTFEAGQVQVGDIIQVDFVVERGSGSENGGARISMSGSSASFANVGSSAPTQGLISGRALIFVGTSGWTARYEPGHSNGAESATNSTDILTASSWTLNGAVYSAATSSRYYMRRMVVRIIR